MQLRTVLPLDVLKKIAIVSVSLILMLALASCQQEEGIEEREFGQTNGQTTEQPAGVAEVYRADLNAINSDLTEEDVSGTAMVQVSADSITFIVDASGLPPGTMHMVHFHGFPDGRNVSCPDMEADRNNDDIVDITEIHQVAGDPIVPLNENPTEADLGAQTYPVADQQGNLRYRMTVSKEDLTNMMQERHNIRNPNWANFAVNIHGIQDTTLPQSVRAMDGMPAYMTIPIACGELERAEGGTQTQMNGQRTNGQTNQQEQQRTPSQSDDY